MDFSSVWEWGVDWIYKLLPLSPFRPYLDQMADLPFLGYLNWFFPISEAITITATWITVIGTYFSYIVVLRWLKVVGD